MSSTAVSAPRLNANEDQALITEVHVIDGQHVNAGDILFVLETTKAASEVLAPVAGVVSSVLAKKGQMVDVGATMCLIGESVAIPADSLDDQQQDVKITAKARLRAKELGLSIQDIRAVNGKIGIAEVEAHSRRNVPARSSTPLETAARLTLAQAVIIGGGGHAATLADALVGTGWDLMGALDFSLPVGTVVVPGLSVIGSDDQLIDLFEKGVRTAFIGVGGATNSGTRRRIYDRLHSIGFHMPPVVHRSAHVGVDVKLGPATYVMPSAMIGPRCRIGANVIVNSGSIVCHDSQIADHAHITPGAILAGTVRVGEGSTVGMAATVLFGAKIGNGTVIHNSAAIVGDVGDNLQYTRSGQRIPNS